MPTFENKNGEVVINMFDYAIGKVTTSKDLNIFARVTTQCDNCKQAIDTSKPKKGKDGKEAEPNPAIEATLSANVDSAETKQMHFCSEVCLYQFLHKRYKK